LNVVGRHHVAAAPYLVSFSGEHARAVHHVVEDAELLARLDVQYATEPASQIL
jgi:hypothetical protein